ncbi:MAG: IctB family putative bicarbonate transporter [Leptolyngbyaceae bacterium]|nr:IctB family putative bicarbonate transporter [Leptolyngbyaceae bacterium]
MSMTIGHVWSVLTLQDITPPQWLQASRLNWVSGRFSQWKKDSWVLRKTELIGLILVSLVFGLAPFISTTLIGILLLCCAGFWGVLVLTEPGGWKVTPIHLPVGVYWAIATLATAFSDVRAQAFEGWIKLTLYLLLFLLLARLMRSPNSRTTVISVYLLVATFVSVFGLRQWIFGADELATWVDPESSLAGTTRVYSYLGNPNLLAGYLIPATIFSAAAIFFWKHWGVKVLAAVMLITNMACLVLTFSRGGWIGFVVAGFGFLLLLIYWILPLLPRFWAMWLIPMVLGGTTAFLTIAVSTVQPLRDRFASIFAGREDSSNNFRINVWNSVIEMIQARPVLGIGPGNDAFNAVYPYYQEPNYTALSAYSVYLEIAVETGFIGLACFLWLMVVTFSHGWRQMRRLRKIRHRDGFWLIAAIAIMVGMLAHGLVDTVWYRPQVSTLWWLMIALVSSYLPADPEQQTLDA